MAIQTLTNNITLRICLALFLAGCSQNDEPVKPVKSLMPAAETQKTPEPGIHDESFASSTGDIIRYTIAIPKSYKATTPTPLIVALHFGGKVTPHYARGIVEALVLPGLGDLNAIVIAPDSIAGRWNNEKNENAVFELMDFVVKRYNIDENKTLLTGFSMGGHGTWYIGSRNQDRFSALIPVAGAPSIEADVEWSTPIYAIHSRADEVVPIEPTEKYMASLKDNANLNTVFAAVDDLPHFQTGSFAKPLRDAVPWVERVWSKE